MPDPVTIGLALTAAYAFFKSRGGNVQHLAMSTLNQALQAGIPIPGTLTIETVLPVLPAGVLKDTIVAVVGNAGPLADRAAMEDEAGVPVDPSDAAAAIDDIQKNVEPAALVLATLIATAGPDLASTKLGQLFPVGVVPIAAMTPIEVVSILLFNLTGAELSDSKALEASLSVGALAQETDVANPDGTQTHVMIRQAANGNVQTQEIVSDPHTLEVLAIHVTTVAHGAELSPLPVSSGLPILVDSPGYMAATKMFPAWSGRFRALNAVSAPSSMYPGSNALAAGTLLNLVTGA